VHQHYEGKSERKEMVFKNLTLLRPKPVHEKTVRGTSAGINEQMKRLNKYSPDSFMFTAFSVKRVSLCL
jgi:hypothetical protein